MSIPGLTRCEDIFREAEGLHRDLMEPWSNRVVEAKDARDRLSIMRQGLATTFRQRYPMPDHLWPSEPLPASPPSRDTSAFPHSTDSLALRPAGASRPHEFTPQSTLSTGHETQ